jgi:hypothetical protein
VYNSNGREKNPEDRVRRNKERYVIDYVEADGRMHGPPLPRGKEWCDETKKWWHNWRKSPQAMLMTETDWEEMQVTALLHNMLWDPTGSTPSGSKFGAVSATQLASEIRQRVGKFGATYEDRKKLRMAVETPMSRKTNEELIREDAEKAVNYAEMLAAEAADIPKA